MFSPERLVALGREFGVSVVPCLLLIRPGASLLIFLSRRRQHAGMISSFLRSLFSAFRPRRSLALENLARRQQLAVLHRSAKRPRLSDLDRGFWVLLHRIWTDWDKVLVIVKPETGTGRGSDATGHGRAGDVVPDDRASLPKYAS